MEFDKSLLGKNVNVGKHEYPEVMFKDSNIELVLKDFLFVKRNINVVFGKILSLFGFTKNDMITLCNMERNGKEVSFSYIVNNTDDINNKITLRYFDLIFKYSIKTSGKDMDITSRVSVFNKRNINLIPIGIEERLDNGLVYSRTYGYNDAIYKISKDGKEIKLFLNSKKRYYDDERMFDLDKEEELESYLKNINLSNSIDTIYKDISLYLGNIDEYADISLKISVLDKEINDDSRLVDVSKVTDMICLKNGVCEEFKITRGNRSITLDKEGNWTSEYHDEFCDITTMVSEYDKATYNISASNDIVLREQVFIYGVNEYEKAIDEIDETQTKVLRMFPKKK